MILKNDQSNICLCKLSNNLTGARVLTRFPTLPPINDQGLFFRLGYDKFKFLPRQPFVRHSLPVLRRPTENVLCCVVLSSDSRKRWSGREAKVLTLAYLFGRSCVLRACLLPIRSALSRVEEGLGVVSAIYSSLLFISMLFWVWKCSGEWRQLQRPVATRLIFLIRMIKDHNNAWQA